MIVRNPATDRTGSVVRGPYRKWGTEWVDVVFPNDFGEPGRYSTAYRPSQLEIVSGEDEAA